MPGNFSSGKRILPLYDFYAALKQNNFLVTPQQIADANSIITEYASAVKNEQDLCNYLTPVFANSLEEQVQFRQIFDEFFTTQKIAANINGETPIKKSHLRKHWWKYVLALLAIIASVLVKYAAVKAPAKPNITLTYHLSNPDSTESTKTALHGTQVRLDVQLTVKDSLQRFTLKKQQFNWGDDSAVDTATFHVYKTEGNFTPTAYVDVYYKNQYRYTDTITSWDPVSICFNKGTLTLQSIPGDSVKIGENIKLEALIKGKKPDSIYWSTQDQSEFKDGKTSELVTSFKHAGVQTFDCKAFYGNENSPCNVESQISFSVYDPSLKPRVLFRFAANAKPVQLSYKVYSYWFYIAGALALFSLFLTAFFALRWQKSKNRKSNEEKQSHEQYDELVRSFSGKSGSADILFQNKNYLPLPEQELSVVARLMRLRISDEVSYMNVQKTICKAILNAGFFNPVMSSRTQQSEFLVLIEENNTNDQQVKLFDFLTDLLKKQNVYIDKFYYRTEPGFCYNANEVNGISLEKLSEKFPQHVLLIFGNAYQLIYPLYPVIDQQYMQLINRWQYKAVMTPVPFLDWGNKEKKVLLPELPVFPVDIPGQLMLMNKLFREDINIPFELQQFSSDFYDTSIVDFEDVGDLAEYCAAAKWATISGGSKYDNILFQWIAALAVYPKIKWEITIVIGKAMLEKHGHPNELNFTNLLRITRISWMKVGQIPEYTRLGLLKVLTLENEIITRETILSVLKEIPETDLNKDHFAYEEKESQRIINEFNLYAYDPVKYAGYKNAKELFAQLNQNDLIMDTTAKTYLDNPSQSWTTLINQPPDEAAPMAKPTNTTLANYLDIKPANNNQLTNFYLWAFSLSAILFVALLIGLISLIVLNFSSSKKADAFRYRQQLNKSIKFNFTDTAFSGSVNNPLLLVDTVQVELQNNQSSALLLNLNDSAQHLSVNLNNNIVFDTTFSVRYDEYNIEFVSDTAKAISKIARPNLTTGTWVLHNAVDDENSHWSNSTLKFTSQKDTIDGLVLDGTFSWTLSSIIQGTENFKGTYSDKNRMIRLTGIVLNDLRNAKAPLALGNYSAVVSSDGNYLSNGTFESGSGQQVAKFKNKWDASREAFVSNTVSLVVSIQVSSDSLVKSANAFKNALESNGYKVNPVDVKNYNYNSDIYYYNSALQGQANAIQKIYNKYYPALKVQAHLRNTPKQGQVDNSIIIWIQQLQSSTVAATAVKQVHYQGRGSAAAEGVVNGKIYFNPKTNGWEEYNDDQHNALPVKKLTVKSIDSRFINLYAPNDKVDIRIDLQLKKIFINNEEFYEVVSSSNEVLTNLPGETKQSDVKADCKRTFNSIDETKKLSSPLVVCKLVLSKEALTALPKELYGFQNMQQLDLGETLIPETEISQLQKALPKCNIIYQVKQANQAAQQTYAPNQATSPVLGEVICTSAKANVRNLPSIKGEITGMVAKGFPLKYVEVITGETYNGNPTWYKDADGRYYWGGDFVQYDAKKKPATKSKKN